MAIVKGLGVPFSFTNKGYPEAAIDVELINNSVFTILSTVVGERVHRPTFGSYLKLFIFDPMSRATIFRVQSEIRRAVSIWEPRVVINDITFEIPQENKILVHVFWTVNRSLTSTTTISIPLNTGV